MKIGRYCVSSQERIAVVIPGSSDSKALDMSLVQQDRENIKVKIGTVADLISGGPKAFNQMEEVLDWALTRLDESWILSSDEVPWDIPSPARGVLCAGRNFGRHKDESLGYWSKQGTTGIHFDFPTGFIKMAHTLVPHKAKVCLPADVLEFDYEVEVVAILGRDTFNIKEDAALDHVFGYTVFNDLSARDWQKKEMRNQMILLGKNFPGFGPIGPWIVTADEIPDPSKLNVSLEVNGNLLQSESCSDMIFDFSKLISFWSKSGLTAGDMIASGTPEGVAMHRKPNPFEFYLKPGDVVRATVDQIGVLETYVI